MSIWRSISLQAVKFFPNNKLFLSEVFLFQLLLTKFIF